jgi:hypothetical protein
VSPGFRLGILLIFAAAPLFAATPNVGPEVAVDEACLERQNVVPELGGSLRVFTRLLTAPHDRAVRH